MTRKALALVQNNDNGFFLLVEGEKNVVRSFHRVKLILSVNTMYQWSVH